MPGLTLADLIRRGQLKTDDSKAVSRTPSLASVSTHVGSELGFEQAPVPRLELDRHVAGPQPIVVGKFWSRRKAFILAVAAAVAYAWWSRYVIRTSQHAAKFGPHRLGRLVSLALTSAFWCLGVRGVKDLAPAPQQQIMLCMHPHGWCGIAPLAILGNEPRRKNGKLENIFILAADIAFKVPGLRELFLFINGRAANEDVIEKVFQAGGSVAVFPGGVHEQLRTDPNQEKLFFPPNLGFVRQAIKHGVPLVPLYNFGENQQFGRWGLPFLPRLHPLQCRIGEAIDVGTADPNPSDTHVRKVFHRYCVELQRLFNKYKAEALPCDVSSRGLQLVWRGHESEDLSALTSEDGPSSIQTGPAKASALGYEVDGLSLAHESVVMTHDGLRPNRSDQVVQCRL